MVFWLGTPPKLGFPMPQKIFCVECGSILYHGLELETPMEIIQRHNGTCPQCKRKLDFETEKVKICPSVERAK
jgi:RNase P subunit RPR2